MALWVARQVGFAWVLEQFHRHYSFRDIFADHHAIKAYLIDSCLIYA